MVASEELEPGHGWDFSSWRFSVTVATSAPLSCRGAHDTYAAQAAEAGTGIDITLSALDLTEIAQLEEALDELANVLAEADPP